MINIYDIRQESVYMFQYMIGIANTGDTSKPWLIAICMIISIIVVAALFVMGQKGNDDEEDDI